MLGLKLPTDPRWVDLTQISLEEILTDHAYCEQKAASSCISLIQNNPHKTELVEQVAPVVTEEWGHFRQVLAMLQKRGLSLGRQRKDVYVLALREFERKGGSPGERLIEKLLVQALIEARSCERFRMLSLHLDDEELRKFYHQFMISEAGHYRMFLDLAYLYGEEKQVSTRWQEYLQYEAEVIQSLEVRGDRIH
ncbi:MAG TPA: tRNA-(ms[2]io[6]A)-hydroxylase [Saprospiraceae bacterium]|nr:tRNA-(ms[2]io[6]A)-hydroxylase [Saprospiraceae bacterium]HQW56026.1 tRNA-(ms[2]io[6]A)-hydroxylase [Saprospiraceae bacterium]